MSATPAVPLTAVLFDFGGTLDSDGIPWKARFFRLWSEEVGEVEPERFDRAFYDADDALVGNLPVDLPLAETAGRLAAGLANGLSAGHGSACERVASRFCEEAHGHLAGKQGHPCIQRRIGIGLPTDLGLRQSRAEWRNQGL